MKITWDDLKIDLTHVDLKRLTDGWNWLIGNDKTPILISTIGDMFLEDRNGKCYWLNVGEGIIQKIAEDKTEFKEQLKNNEIVSEWFLVELVSELKKSGMVLKENKLYSYKVLPILGGEYEIENFDLIDIEVHFEFSGQIHKQIKDLPDGTKVNIVLE